MGEESRTRKSVKNSVVALAMYFINLVLQFYSRKIFLDYLGTEVLGLNTTVTNLLQFLNLAELGIGAAIGVTLYRPIYDNDRDAINEILTLNGHYYRRIAMIVIAGAAALMCFFPWIFSKMELPLWYAYASFGVVLLSALLSYFVNYRQVLLSADQKDYKIQYGYRSVMIAKVACQMLAVRFMPDPYIWWLVFEAIFAVVAAYNLNRIIKKTYPYLREAEVPLPELKKRHPSLITKIKQVFFHKLGGFALTQSSPLIIYAYATLTLVAYYGNYQMLVVAITALINSVFNSMAGAVGNLVAAGDRDHSLSVFDELFSLRFLVVTTVCVGYVMISSPLVSLWLGSQYVLEPVTVLLITINMFLTLNRTTVDNFLFAYGLFADIYAPVVETILNIGLSVLLGYYYGLNGILSGVCISLIVVIFLWKPYYLFSRGFALPITRYLRTLGLSVAGFVAGCMVLWGLSSLIQAQETSMIEGLIHGIVATAIYALVCFGVLMLLPSGLSRTWDRLAHRNRVK